MGTSKLESRTQNPTISADSPRLPVLILSRFAKRKATRPGGIVPSRISLPQSWHTNLGFATNGNIDMFGGQELWSRNSVEALKEAIHHNTPQKTLYIYTWQVAFPQETSIAMGKLVLIYSLWQIKESRDMNRLNRLLLMLLTLILLTSCTSAAPSMSERICGKGW